MGLRMAAIGTTGSKGRCLFSLQQVHLFGDQIGTRQSGLERKPGVCFVVETGPEAAAGSWSRGRADQSWILSCESTCFVR